MAKKSNTINDKDILDTHQKFHDTLKDLITNTYKEIIEENG